MRASSAYGTRAIPIPHVRTRERRASMIANKNRGLPLFMTYTGILFVTAHSNIEN